MQFAQKKKEKMLRNTAGKQTEHAERTIFRQIWFLMLHTVSELPVNCVAVY